VASNVVFSLMALVRKPLPSGLKGTKPIPSFLERRQHLLFGLPPPQGIFALNRRVSDKVLHCSRHVLDRHVWVDAMLIEEIDAIGLEPLERSVSSLLDAVWPTIQASLLARVRVEIEAEFGCDHNLFAKG
jgi:hypothetical protein